MIHKKLAAKTPVVDTVLDWRRACVGYAGFALATAKAYVAVSAKIAPLLNKPRPLGKNEHGNGTSVAILPLGQLYLITTVGLVLVARRLNLSS